MPLDAATNYPNVVGVQTHLRKTGTGYMDFAAVTTALTDLGVKPVRDTYAVGWPTLHDQLATLGQAGYRLLLTHKATDTVEGFVAGITGQAGGVDLTPYLDAVEGVNEWDNTGRPGWADEVRTRQAALYAAVKKVRPNLPVLAPALADPSKAAALGPVACDVGNAHAYPNGKPATWVTQPHTGARTVAPGKPLWVTETGYTNALADPDVRYLHPVTETTAAGYAAELVTTHLDAGAARVYLYELLDQGTGNTDVEQAFGLVRADGLRKPIFAVIQRLLAPTEAPMPTDPLIVACPFCKAPPSSPCVYLTGPNAGKPRGAAYGPHADRIRAADAAAPVYVIGFKAGASSRGSEVQALTDRLDETQAALETTQGDLDEALDTTGQLGEQVRTLTAQVTALTTQRNTAQQALDQANAALVAEKAGRVTDRTVAAQLVIELRATIADLEAYKTAHPDRPPVVVVDPPVVIPADALYLSPNGNDANTGTASSPKRTPVPGRFNAHQSGTWDNYRYFNKTVDTTLAAVPGATAIWDGKGVTENAILAGGDRLKVIGLEFRNYKPIVEETNATNFESALYVTGNGQVFTDIKVTDCGMTGIKILGDDVQVIRPVLTRTGKTGISADTAARLLIDRPRLVGLNMRVGNRGDDTAAIKVTRSGDTKVIKPYVRDGAGIAGVWFDTACPRVLIQAPDIDGAGVDGRAKMGMGVFIEGADGGKFDGVQGYSRVIGGTITGTKAGAKYLDSGWITTWGVDLRGNDIGIYMQQDWRYNTGTIALELTADQSPWLTKGHIVGNTSIDGPHPVIAYADGASHTLPTQCQIKGVDMFDRFGGNWIDGAVELGVIPVASRVAHRTQAALDAAGGTRFVGNYFGTDATEAARVRVAAPADVAALLA